ncbi:hypothetical protein [Vibrio bivalvicida]|uniref:Uncharacterized protein n=1 Tax=Vibrio bivalvicida TaxID=1276888 RepID=A0A177Y129_9VIBR|nr:hypothetical protein [Vibrio bivalvicida]OAJ94241.1 hypothetical protein APB76_10515 [Vibrio bivalvicida]OAJ94540.1 hypothetical protein APB76_09485 [Vibrio bivalvicida]
MKKILSCLVLSAAVFSSNLFAWDGVQKGKLGQIHVTDDGNMVFRVTLASGITMCGNQHTWAYLDKSHSSYDSYVSAFLSAKFAGANVTIYTNKDDSSQSYCRVGYIVVE